MNSSYQGHSQGSTPDHQQGATSGASEQSEQNFILVETDQGLQINTEEMILGQVRRRDTVRPGRQGGSGDSRQHGGPTETSL